MTYILCIYSMSYSRVTILATLPSLLRHPRLWRVSWHSAATRSRFWSRRCASRSDVIAWRCKSKPPWWFVEMTPNTKPCVRRVYTHTHWYVVNKKEQALDPVLVGFVGLVSRQPSRTHPVAQSWASEMNRLSTESGGGITPYAGSFPAHIGG